VRIFKKALRHSLKEGRDDIICQSVSRFERKEGRRRSFRKPDYLRKAMEKRMASMSKIDQKRKGGALPLISAFLPDEGKWEAPRGNFV